MGDCIFCKIVKGELPSSKVYENDKVVVILDINPVMPGHVLVIPKEHHTNVLETPDALLDEILRTVKKLAPSIMKATGCDGFNIGVNTGPTAGQLVLHTHFHVMPRQAKDELRLWKGKKYKDGEAGSVLAKIKDELNKQGIK